jgi:hypothetical protein
MMNSGNSENIIRKALMEASIALSWATHGHLTEDDAKECLELVDAALNETKLNCNVGTAEEQIERHHKTYCREYNSTPTCLTHNGSCALCFARWSQTPYNNDMKGSDDDIK